MGFSDFVSEVVISPPYLSDFHPFPLSEIGQNEKDKGTLGSVRPTETNELYDKRGKDSDMTRQAKLSDDEITAAMADLHTDWDHVNGRLRRELVFTDFVEAFSFMAAVALHAEKADHHPNWANVYNRVEIDLFTHDVDGITSLDFDIAASIDSAAKSYR